ncbi:unnamed protein product [Polarella glacialis]|uniref:Uncharacterized protein n=1 Tax=Polarella glacialis TaxID=89957 RepID=A0A813IZ55_POLGL|nr:unnamed protein product [Polarella glacialis]
MPTVTWPSPTPTLARGQSGIEVDSKCRFHFGEKGVNRKTDITACQQLLQRRRDAITHEAHYFEKLESLRAQISRSGSSPPPWLFISGCGAVVRAQEHMPKLAEKLDRNQEKLQEIQQEFSVCSGETGRAVSAALERRWFEVGEVLAKICQYYMSTFSASGQLIVELQWVQDQLVRPSTADAMVRKGQELASQARDKVSNMADGLRSKWSNATGDATSAAAAASDVSASRHTAASNVSASRHTAASDVSASRYTAASDVSASRYTAASDVSASRYTAASDISASRYPADRDRPATSSVADRFADGAAAAKTALSAAASTASSTAAAAATSASNFVAPSSGYNNISNSNNNNSGSSAPSKSKSSSGSGRKSREDRGENPRKSSSQQAFGGFGEASAYGYNPGMSFPSWPDAPSSPSKASSGGWPVPTATTQGSSPWPGGGSSSPRPAQHTQSAMGYPDRSGAAPPPWGSAPAQASKPSQNPWA